MARSTRWKPAMRSASATMANRHRATKKMRFSAALSWLKRCRRWRSRVQWSGVTQLQQTLFDELHHEFRDILA